MFIKHLLRIRPTFLHYRLPPLQENLFQVTRFARMSSAAPPKLANVAVETEEGIAVVKYNRPKAGNALNTPTLEDIAKAYRWAEQNDNVRVIVTTGEGKFYTTGLDLLDPVNQGSDSTISDEFIDVLSEIHKTLINSNKVLISAVNGPAPGWGTSSLVLSDLVYSVPDAIFFTPFVQWGLCAEACSSHTFKTLLGRQKASALILAGQRMTPQELESAGLITKILPREGFFDEVMKIARGIVKLPPKTLRVNKELMMRGTREELLRVNEVELAVLKEQARGTETKEAIRGFAETQAAKKKKQAAKL